MSWKNAFCWLLGSLLIGCAGEATIETPDVSHIEMPVEINRFEKELFALDTSNLEMELAALEERYPEFSNVYFTYVLASRNPQVAPEGHLDYVRGFLTHPAIQYLYDTTQTVYPDLSAVREDFQQAFRYLKYYLPEVPTPSVTTYISEYTIAAFVYGDGDLGVGLDFFLGADYPYARYNPGNPNFSAYLTRSFDPRHLVSKSLQPLIQDLVGPPAGERLLDYMINNGKQLYLSRLLLPEVADSILLEMPQQQVEWLKDNELEIWAHFLKEDILYSNDFQKFRKLVEYSPHSPGMPPEAPGRTANWTGMRIIESYMRRHPNTTVAEMLAMQDSGKLLQESRYKPRE